ncbi:hypothetical protein GCM10020331_003800 [Ectobacillus funiculus]
MSIIRQESLFGMQDLYELEPTKRFDAIFQHFTSNRYYSLYPRKTVYGAPTELNYPAMIYALVVRIVERIPTIKDLVKTFTP